ncbi:PREDICTED: uncharacterized protein LOC104827275 isoform X2 [Tarenaya hassleriana]|uniref:uncharacterized protein LOC104827275 isoform X2 n=1 Tax=Tarenaya hassleriana TaxID=28532 RepID=UPI00053C3CA4|nr:PREDICTED: uncharacterized protein LOC104827275 isoform X2 [Tarenaya hassleriana]
MREREREREMDLGEWELLSRSNYNIIDHLDDDGVMIRNPNPNHERHLDMDHFIICPSQDPTKQTEHNPGSQVVPTQLLQVPITWEPIFSPEDTDHDKMTKLTDKVSVLLPVEIHPGLLPDPVPSPHRVSFKKMKGNESVDMKLIDPAKVTSHLPGIGSEGEDGGLGSKKDDLDKGLNKGNDGEELNLWKLGLTGIGAICSFGVAAAAATICAVFFGNNNKNCRNKNQVLRLQIYSDDDKG